MWIHQRTGKNTAVSYRLGAVLFGLFMAGAAVAHLLQPGGSVVLLPIGLFAVLTGALWLKLNGDTRAQRAERREHRRLAAVERMELLRQSRASAEAERVADLQRLRGKYTV